MKTEKIGMATSPTPSPNSNYSRRTGASCIGRPGLLTPVSEVVGSKLPGRFFSSSALNSNFISTKQQSNECLVSASEDLGSPSKKRT